MRSLLGTVLSFGKAFARFVSQNRARCVSFLLFSFPKSTWGKVKQTRSFAAHKRLMSRRTFIVCGCRTWVCLFCYTFKHSLPQEFHLKGRDPGRSSNNVCRLQPIVVRSSFSTAIKSNRLRIEVALAKLRGTAQYIFAQSIIFRGKLATHDKQYQILLLLQGGYELNYFCLCLFVLASFVTIMIFRPTL